VLYFTTRGGKLMSTVDKRLSECRRRSMLTFDDLAKRTGWSESTFKQTHRGGQKASKEFLALVAPIYKTTEDWLEAGDPKVNVYSDFIETSAHRVASDPSFGPVRRAAAVLTYLENRFPGHLTVNDIADYLGIRSKTLEKIVSGEADEVPEHLVKAISRFSGVPASWIELGNFGPWASLGVDNIETITSAEMRMLLQLGVRAKAAGVPIDKLVALIEAKET
jgi:transcriptional regulator with XRE-family HTH domain